MSRVEFWREAGLNVQMPVSSCPSMVNSERVWLVMKLLVVVALGYT